MDTLDHHGAGGTWFLQEETLPACNASVQTAIHRFAGGLIHRHGIPPRNCFRSKNLLHSKDVQQWARAWRIPGLSRVPHHAVKTALKEQWACLLKTEVRPQPGGETLQGLGGVP